jgi:hypothetical protein
MGFHTRQRHKKIREVVFNRDGLVCCYCDSPLTRESATLDHIVPDSKRGTFNATNLTVSCSYCNNKRGALSFFEFCKQFNFTDSKLLKYKNLYFSNLKIKVLNIAKEECLVSDEAIPLFLIQDACNILRINIIDFSTYQNIEEIQIRFEQIYHRKIIKFNFEKLIKFIELHSFDI